MNIIRINEARLDECLEVIHKSFATVAEEFGFTRENCPTHTSFMPIEKLRKYAEWGFEMFGMEDNGRIIGYVSVSHNPDGKFELHNLAVLPEYRHGGIGRKLVDRAKEAVAEKGGNRLHIGIIEEHTVLKNWYETNGFVSTGTQKFEHLPFTVEFMECVIQEKNMGHFHIYAKSLHWLGTDKDLPGDLCLHGTVVAEIGDEVFEDECTTSSTALYLLKSLAQNHIIYKQACQMLPCCGHFFIPNDDLTEVETMGCPNGTDWSVIHENDTVKIITESDKETVIDIDEYRKEVFAFADEIEAYYKKSQPKTFFDDYEEKGFTAYWNEFHRRRNV